MSAGGSGGCGLVAKNFLGRWHGNPIWKSYSEMSLKKVMYNQHDFYMHTPISAFACYNTPLQASYQSDTCKRRTISTKRITNKRMVGVWLSCHLPLGSSECRACSPTCISPLIVRAPCDNQPYYIHSSWFLTALIKYVLSQHTGVVELRRSPAGKVGVSPFPILWRSALDHVYHL